MKTSLLHFIARFILTLAAVYSSQQAIASHAQSADITYSCVGGNTYNVRLAFYRDCAGVAAPNTVSINIASASCNEDFNITLNRIPGTGIDVTPICPTMTSQCNGGSYPGVQEWIYEGQVTLPAQCTDWILSFSLCCRNNAISTINNPGGDNIYVEAHLDNAQFPCNNSPQFSNKPVPFVCVGQSYCFNHGAVDADGDSLVYELVPPATGPNTTVTYFAGYSATQPLNSVPAVSINSQTGDICMTPQMLEVSVMAVKVSEYRNGELVGSVIRDIQVRVISCTNSNPSISGINGGNTFSASTCAGSTLSFTINSSDPDANQNLTLSWNNAIPGASFTSSGGQQPTATFTWTPNSAQVSNVPYCFTVTVADDNCPLNGSQTYSFCITVTGFNITANSTSANCGANNGTASVSVNGGIPPYSYSWSSGNNTPTVNGLAAGTYTINVSDASGCIMSANTTVAQGAAPGTISLNSTPVSCYGGNNGSASVNVNGGLQPYTYLWSNNSTASAITGLNAGTYNVSVTTANGCISTGSITVNQPLAPLSLTGNSTPVSCYNGNNGSVSVVASGGTAPYSYTWNNQPQNTASQNNLIAGLYQVTVTDAAGCTQNTAILLTQASPITLIQSNATPVTCFGGNNGSASVTITGGTGSLDYSWNNGVNSSTNTANNLSAGNYTVTATDDNGCQQNFTLSITQPQALTATLVSINHVSCTGLYNGSISANAQGGTAPYTYFWNSFPTQNVPVANLLPAGTYQLTVTDAHACTATLSATVNEPTPLTLSTSTGDTICPGTFTTISAQAAGGSGNYSYNWSNGLGNAGSHSVSPAATTVYTVSASDGNGCNSPLQNISITVNDVNLIQFGVTATPVICEGEPATVLAEISGGIGNYQIAWNNGLPASTGPHTHFPTSSGYYTATVTDVCGNQRTESAWIDVNLRPQVQLSPQVYDECGEAYATLYNDFPNSSGSAYEWNFGDGHVSSQEVPTHVFTQSGTYTVSLEVTTAAGCSNNDTTQIAVNIRPRAVAGFEVNDDDLSIFDPQAQFINTSTNASTANWDFGDGNGSVLFSPSHTYATVGSYTVTLIMNNSFDCPDTTSRIILVSPEFTFYVPNAFTPDGDGKNDVFFGKGENIAEFEMLIFDRWGEVVFSTQNQNAHWDGTYRGANEPKQDVYVYKIKIKDSVKGHYHYYDGHVAIVK